MRDATPVGNMSGCRRRGGPGLSAAGWMFDPGQFYRSYLVSYLLWLGIALAVSAT